MSRWGSYDWNAAAIERLKTLWTEGYSASEVGAFLGVSRNSVIGKLHRLGLTGMQRRRTRPKGSNAPKLAPPPKPKPKPVRQPPQIPQMAQIQQMPREPVIGSYTLMDLRYGVCKWPEGEQSPYSYCGAPALENESYCADHHRRAHQGPQHRALRPIESYAIRRSRQAA